MIKLSAHARLRLAERAIAEEWVALAIVSPDWTVPDVDPALTQSFRAVEASAHRILKVVHRTAGADILVVTAHFDRSAKP